MRWVVLGLAIAFLGIGLLVSWVGTDSTPPPPTVAEQPVSTPVAATATPEETAKPEPTRDDPVAEPTPRPIPVRTEPVAKAPPPLPPAEPGPATEAPKRELPPAATQIVWADDIKKRLSQEQLRDLRNEANALPADASMERRNQLAGALGERGQGDAQLAVLAGGVRSNPEAIGPRVAYGAALMRQRLWSQAITQWRAVLARDAEQPYAWHNLAVALQESGALGDALDAWNEALRLAPDNIDGYAQRGLLLLQRENHPAAVADFSRVLEREDDAPDALLNGSLAALHSEQFDLAREWAWKAAENWQNRPALVVTAIERLCQIALLSGKRDVRAEQMGYQMLNEGRGTEALRELLRQLREANG